MRQPGGDNKQTEFLNVDLDVFSRERLTPFVNGLGKSFFVLHEGRWGRKYAAILELAAGGSSQRNNPDRLIRRMVTLLNKMPRTARSLWDRAQVKQFNIGIQAALKPHAFDIQIGQETLQEVAGLGARLIVTVYAAEAPKARESPRQRKRASRPTRNRS